MGKARKPLALQKGNLTQEQQEKIKRDEELATVGREHLREPPTWLVNQTAINEFHRIVKEFENIKVVGNLDLNNLGAYCNAYAFYIMATEELRGEDLVIRKPLPNGSSTLAENPLVKIQKNYAEEMRRFGAKCGLDIDSRLKCGSAQTEKEQDSVKEDFGDI